jgi:hypothetical protein
MDGGESGGGGDKKDIIFIFAFLFAKNTEHIHFLLFVPHHGGRRRGSKDIVRSS